MMSDQPTPPVCNAAILTAALELQRLFDTQFAISFLVPYGFKAEVVEELLYPSKPSNLHQ